MKQITLITIIIALISCSQQNENNMGFFDKLFGKKEKQELSNQSKSKIPIQDSKELMDDDKFWEIIAQTKLRSNDDYEVQQEELRKELLKLEPIEILKFDNRFRTYRGEAYKWELWAAAYVMNGGCSDDCFSDFRGWLIGQGKATYFKAIENPETLVELNHDMDNDDWEGLSYVPMTIYEEKTGNDMPKGIQENSEITGEEWEEEGDDLKNKFPKLWSKWGFE
jgi:hypothetical protein